MKPSIQSINYNDCRFRGQWLQHSIDNPFEQAIRRFQQCREQIQAPYLAIQQSQDGYLQITDSACILYIQFRVINSESV